MTNSNLQVVSYISYRHSSGADHDFIIYHTAGADKKEKEICRVLKGCAPISCPITVRFGCFQHCISL